MRILATLLLVALLAGCSSPVVRHGPLLSVTLVASGVDSAELRFANAGDSTAFVDTGQILLDGRHASLAPCRDDATGACTRALLPTAFELAPGATRVGVVMLDRAGDWVTNVTVGSAPDAPRAARTNDTPFLVGSTAMGPRFAVGDAVRLAPRPTNITDIRTMVDGGEPRFGAAGDVLLFEPHVVAREPSAGPRPHPSPILHRAIAYVEVANSTYRVRWPARLPCEGDATRDESGPGWCVYGPTGIDAPTFGLERAGGDRPFQPERSGFLTRGDNATFSELLDQAVGLTDPVEPDWILGVADLRTAFVPSD